MRIDFKVTGKDRKKLVDIIANVTNEEAVYEKAPTYAYSIGGFTVTREGTVDFDSTTIDEALITPVFEALKEAGYKYDTNEDIAIGYPIADFAPEKIANLQQMVNSKAPLIKKALGLGELPIEQTETELTFRWLKSGLSKDERHAVALFIKKLCDTAKAKTRVVAKNQEEFVNEKFAMRIFMISLGMKGAEYATARTFMMSKLDGSAGNKFDEPVNPRGGERVQKEVISIRFTPDTLERLENLARISGMSRNGYIGCVIAERIEQGYIFNSEGEGYVTNAETAENAPEIDE
jgi:hypothetical protein